LFKRERRSIALQRINRLKLKSKKSKRINDKTLIATVDIGMRMNTGYCRSGDGSDFKILEFSNNWSGFNQFWDYVCLAKQESHSKDVIVGLESTGHYGLPLVHYLREKKVKFVQVNPMHTKRLKELPGNSPNKTDYKDPKVIADIIELGHSLSLIVSEGAVAELRRLIHARERSLQKTTVNWNQLQSLVFLIFPEFIGVMKDIKTKSAQYLLKHYPRPQDIVKLGVGDLSCKLKKVSRGQLGEERAKALYEAAKHSVGVKEGLESNLFEQKQILSLIGLSESFVAEAEKQMSHYLSQVSYSKYLLSLKGLGLVTVAGLIGEAGDFTKFKTQSEIIKLAGLDLFEISSGKHQGVRRISKRGRPLMRKILFFAALNVTRKGGILHDRYQQYLESGMVKIKALIAISRKLLAILFALARDETPYRKDFTQSSPLLKAA
jgi:transposase